MLGRSRNLPHISLFPYQTNAPSYHTAPSPRRPTTPHRSIPLSRHPPPRSIAPHRLIAVQYGAHGHVYLSCIITDLLTGHHWLILPPPAYILPSTQLTFNSTYLQLILTSTHTTFNSSYLQLILTSTHPTFDSNSCFQLMLPSSKPATDLSTVNITNRSKDWQIFDTTTCGVDVVCLIRDKHPPVTHTKTGS